MQKTVFISGASSGIGLITAQQLHQMGWKVYASGLPEDDFSILSAEIIAVPLDIRDHAAIQAFASQLERLDALVNNAGIQIPSPLEAISIDALRQQFEVNVFGHLAMIQALLPHLRKSPSPRIVNVSSLMGKVAMPTLGAYSMSKHALEAMSDTLRMELAPFGISVSLIEMGAIATPMNEAAIQTLEAAENKTAEPLQSLYQWLFKGMKTALKNQAKSAIPPEKVSKAIIHAITAKKPKARYQVDAATKGLFMMRKFAPEEIGDKILMWALGLKP